jgi:ABC-2 type transport system ATP-binding protein
MVVILDEPTVGLDPVQIRDIRTLIKEIGKEHSVIVSTHILPEVEMICDHVQIIDQGKMVFNGDIEVLKRQRMGDKLLVGFNKTPDLDTVAKIKGVADAELTGNNMVRIRVEEGAEPQEAIVKAAVRNGWGLYQIAPDQTSLEDVFIQLTYQNGAQDETQAPREPTAA